MRYKPQGFSRRWLIGFYREQLRRFNKIGLGNKTEFGTTITETVLRSTTKRLNELTSAYANHKMLTLRQKMEQIDEWVNSDDRSTTKT